MEKVLQQHWDVLLKGLSKHVFILGAVLVSCRAATLIDLIFKEYGYE